MQRTDVHTVRPVVRLESSSGSDIAAQDSTSLARLLFVMQVIRSFEMALLQASNDGRLHGPVHTSVGQEIVPATLLAYTRPGDWVFGGHRSHHHLIGQALSRLLPTDWNAATDTVPESVHHFLTAAMAEIVGCEGGLEGGVGGSMHLRAPGIGFGGTSAIVGGAIPLAAGAALSAKLRTTDGAAVCFIGDGALNQGVFHETANLSGLLSLPLLIVVENNGYAEATTPSEASALPALASQGAAHGMAAWQVHGDDPAALLAAAAECWSVIREGLPAMIEVITYRHFDHTGPHPGSKAGYRSVEEEADAWRRDPLESIPPILRTHGLLDSVQVRQVIGSAHALIDTIADDVSARQVASHSLDVASLLRSQEPLADATCNMREHSPQLPAGPYRFRESIAAGIANALRTRTDVVFLGEEVGKPGGILWQAGLLGAGRSLPRVINMPISEAGFVGLGGGLAMTGMRPIVELMYGSFVLVAADQLFNHIGAVRALYGGNASAPVIVRTKVPYGRGYGAQHGLNPVALFASFPGWRIAAPATPQEWLGTFNSALECEDPVLILEFTELYDEKFDVTPAEFTTSLPLWGHNRIRSGSDATIVTYGLGVSLATQAADLLAAAGTQVEIIDLRALDMLSIDVAGLRRALSRTGHGLFVEPSPQSHTIAPRLWAEIGQVDGLVLKSLSCADVQPVARALEAQALIDVKDIVQAIEEIKCCSTVEDAQHNRVGSGVRE
ncbi:thiamine pyrophosphate-dependent enzyme [Rhodococcus artemisiae]|uniref:dihydrolipoyllysine-residue succinyltransferase n=1 Tax=Rhodococcus artemisiae TaxID=714159 RepID=A0ABU7LBY8_9NOCA|nr:thiamine pyrophosphate-dependent enzyme [Rhodococcus artemisiae]MEE2059066.1 thiamine pyrophosphate-dependent enzyme [Rhodococcus artemisiae]